MGLKTSESPDSSPTQSLEGWAWDGRKGQTATMRPRAGRTRQGERGEEQRVRGVDEERKERGEGWSGE